MLDCFAIKTVISNIKWYIKLVRSKVMVIDLDIFKTNKNA